MLNEFLNQIRANPRLRIGVWLILGIFWLYGLLELRDIRQEVQDNHHSVAERVARMQGQASQTAWLTRAESTKLIEAGMESHLWQASSGGMAQAVLEDWLRSTLTDAGAIQLQIKVAVLDDVNLTSEEEESTPSDLWKVRANLSFSINPENLTSVVSKIELSERYVAIEMIKIHNEVVPRLDMQLIAYMQQKEDATQDSKPLVFGLPLPPPSASPLSETSPPGLNLSATLPAKSPADLQVVPQTPFGVLPAPAINPFILQPGNRPIQTAPNTVPIMKNPFMP